MCVCTDVEHVLLDSVYELSLILSINLKMCTNVCLYLNTVQFLHVLDCFAVLLHCNRHHRIVAVC